jgi:hypothetical protein
MPSCPLHLIALVPEVSLSSFLHDLKRHQITPIIQSKVVRWIILPSKLSLPPLLAHNNHWDLLLVLPSGTQLPETLSKKIFAKWSLDSGVPSRLLADFEAKNQQLLNPPSGAIKPAKLPSQGDAESSQSLELSPELHSWIEALDPVVRRHPISMLNLLSFLPNKKDEYLKYGAEFAKKAGSQHGGVAKIVGHVVGGSAKDDGWDEIAVAHYPSLEHFAEMLASKDYQKANHKYRLGSLRDTFILCTMEVNDDGELAGGNISAKI